MSKKRIVLIGYPAVYFLPFGRSMETHGFDVYWVCGLTSGGRYLERNGVAPDHVLDVNAGFRGADGISREERNRLSELESPAGPMINDLILMDRILRRKPAGYAHGYLAHLHSVIEPFLQRNRIELATSWRDTALQLLGMLICRKLEIPWIVPTRIRIPQEMYGFCSAHYTQSFIPLREVTSVDREWAEGFLRDFRARKHRPALKIAARTYWDVLCLLPTHMSAFWFELKRAPADYRNDCARYSVSRLIWMYLRRRINLALYKLLPPYAPIGRGPYCLYALHTQPESSIDVASSFFSDQIGLIRMIARSLPATSELYVKVHPTDVDGQPPAFYREIGQIPGVRILHYAHESRALVDGCQVVFALTGTIAYEAALLGKPVIVFARNFFNDLPNVRYCGTPEALPAVVRAAMQDVARDSEPEIVEVLARLKAWSFPGEVSRLHEKSSPLLRDSDLATLAEAYHTLHTRLRPVPRNEG